MKLKWLAVFYLTATCIPASAFDTYYLKSSYDKFSIKKKIDGFYYLGSKKVNLEPMNDFLPLLSGTVEGSCGELGEKPDLKITGVKNEPSGLGKKTVRTLEFFISKGVIKKGSECAPVGGDGMFYLPLHRAWFVGKRQISITANSMLEIKKAEQVLVSAEKFQGSWRNTSGGIGTNWEFFKRYLASLQDFDIQARLHIGAGEGKPQLDINIDGKSYTGYLIANNLWALKLPKVNWLLLLEKCSC
ncbi:MAG: hypothetical protein AAF202_01350 [Pseudomonadota bacterium]